MRLEVLVALPVADDMVLAYLLFAKAILRHLFPFGNYRFK